jgi:hypothetical protein
MKGMMYNISNTSPSGVHTGFSKGANDNEQQ